MTPIVVLTASTGRAQAALNRLGISFHDRRLTVMHRAEQLKGWARDAVAVCLDDDPATLPRDLQSAAAERSLRLIPFADLPATLAGMRP
jgi:hypothetical protein